MPSSSYSEQHSYVSKDKFQDVICHITPGVDWNHVTRVCLQSVPDLGIKISISVSVDLGLKPSDCPSNRSGLHNFPT
jgi:hypothetical protein